MLLIPSPALSLGHTARTPALLRLGLVACTAPLRRHLSVRLGGAATRSTFQRGSLRLRSPQRFRRAAGSVGCSFLPAPGRSGQNGGRAVGLSSFLVVFWPAPSGGGKARSSAMVTMLPPCTILTRLLYRFNAGISPHQQGAGPGLAVGRTAP